MNTDKTNKRFFCRKSEQMERGHRIVGKINGSLLQNRVLIAEYHTTNKYLNLTVPLYKSTRDKFAVVKDGEKFRGLKLYEILISEGELKCVGTCSIYHGKPFYNDST